MQYHGGRVEPIGGGHGTLVEMRLNVSVEDHMDMKVGLVDHVAPMEGRNDGRVVP